MNGRSSIRRANTKERNAFDALNAPTNQGGRPRRQAVNDFSFSYSLPDSHTSASTSGQGRVAHHDRGYQVSLDGTRQSASVVPSQRKKRKIRPVDLVGEFSQWTPADKNGVDGRSFEYMEMPAIVDVAGDEIEIDVPGKRKRYTSSDNPMSLWREMSQVYLDENIRREGLGNSTQSPRCCSCGIQPDPTLSYTDSPVLFRCEDCGEFLECKACCLKRHQCSPLHILRGWNGDFWKHVSLSTLGLTYQLGHGGGDCLTPSKTHEMTVIHINGIHTLRVTYCGCSVSDHESNIRQLMRNAWYPATTIEPHSCATYQVLETFRLLNVVGNVNVRDYVTTLEEMTSATGTHWIADRYKSFGRMSRQWAFIKRCKRAGRGHQKSGIIGTKLGELAVPCWACPREGINLPQNWRDVDPKYKFLFMLILAADANFRMKNRLRANARSDPPLGPGWGYQVEPESYKEHLNNYVSEEDISTCIAFAALLEKDTKLTTGLRCTGVGGCICARHEVLRPQGMGDLQKGERYANMDFIIFSAIMGVMLSLIMLSYDIACQYKINVSSRMRNLPERLQIDETKTTLLYALPVWHGNVHETKCNTENSLKYQTGGGGTDGEGIERVWSKTNELGYATKEMGVGTRHDAIEDRLDHHNFKKNINIGKTLDGRLRVAVEERNIQIESYQEITATLRKEVRREWEQSIKDWQEDRTKPNPYAPRVKEGLSEAQVRLQLSNEETAEAARGAGNFRDTSPAGFLLAGLHLEDAQEQIRSEQTSEVNFSLDRAAKVQDRRRIFFSKLASFRRLQEHYMPAAILLIKRVEEEHDPDVPPPNAEDTQLYLPSHLKAEHPNSPLLEGLVIIEARLREAQCTDAIALVRQRLHAKRFLINHRNGNSVGQKQMLRSRSLITGVSERIQTAAKKYRRSRAALISLRGSEACVGYRELRDEDIKLVEMSEGDARALKKLGRIGGRDQRITQTSLASSNTPLSWIWTGFGGPEDEERQLHDSVRVEWAKSLARKTRWEEEVMLLREEMRRVLRSLAWGASEWTRRAEIREDVSAEMNGGLRAYALSQKNYCEVLLTQFRNLWSVPLKIQQEYDLHDTFVADTEDSSGSVLLETTGADGAEATGVVDGQRGADGVGEEDGEGADSEGE